MRNRLLRSSVAIVCSMVWAVTACASGTDDDSVAPPTADTPATTLAPSPSDTPATTTTAPPTATTTTAPTTTMPPPTTATTTTAPIATTLPTTPPTTPTPAATVRAYFHRSDEVIGPVARPVSGDPVATSRAALEGLLAGPTDEERAIGFGSEIPVGTRLLGVRIEDGVSFVDLSSDFEAGGGSSSMTMRLLQVLYTATQFDSVDAMRLLLDGVLVDVFSGEGVIVDHPLSRSEFDLDLQVPAILVEGPLPFETIAGPLRVHGTANVFEATVQLRVALAGGGVLFEGFVNATCGSGCRGTFDVTVPVDAAGAAIVTVYEDSPEDGSPIHVVEIPVTLG